MTTFGLVHGAWHGAWCWERLIAELRSRGHDAIAVDLPIDDPTAATDRYADAAVAAFAGAPDDLVIVGHSLGGTVIPIVASRRPARALVYLCPVIRSPGRTLAETMMNDGDATAPGWGDDRIFHDDASSSWPAEAAITAFYPDCDPDIAAAAAGNLRRQYWRYWDEPNPIDRSPDTAVRAIVAADDSVVRLPWAFRRIPELLGVEPEILPGGHSPFLSRPGDLANLLVREP